MLTNRDARLDNLAEWLEVRGQTIDDVPIAAELRGLIAENKALRGELRRARILAAGREGPKDGH